MRDHLRILGAECFFLNLRFQRFPRSPRTIFSLLFLPNAFRLPCSSRPRTAPPCCFYFPFFLFFISRPISPPPHPYRSSFYSQYKSPNLLQICSKSAPSPLNLPHIPATYTHLPCSKNGPLHWPMICAPSRKWFDIPAIRETIRFYST